MKITNTYSLLALIITTIINIFMMIYLSKNKKKNQVTRMFTYAVTLLAFWCLGLILQIILSSNFNIQPIYFDYFVYIPICLLPVSVFFLGLIYEKTKIKFKRIYFLLFIEPIIALLVLWTNDLHHLFYVEYSTILSKTVYGPYIAIHNIYSYATLFVGILYLIKASVKNSGSFSKQSLLIILGISIPAIINVLGTFQLIPMSIYITPITFTATILLCAIAIFKFKFLGVTPIALQKIVDQISDSFVVLDDDNIITDFNQTFINSFGIKSPSIRGISIESLLKIEDLYLGSSKLYESLTKVRTTNQTLIFEQNINKINKIFSIEISSISSSNSTSISHLGTLILFKDITQHKRDMETIKNNQETIIEQERLASLGQMIGGIAHNLKTPIMSISGAAEGLLDLIKEYDSSIDDPEVNSQDHHDIAKDMSEWITKIKTHTEYMSDVITAVKGQAVSLSNDQDISFTVEELLKRVNILMKHELKNAIIYLNISIKADGDLQIHGDVNNLVQVINNMISNAIQAYNGKTEQNIDLVAETDNKNNLIISIKDYASGIPQNVLDKLFKEMITTKGKNGTGLGLYMSYSTIRGHFNGNIVIDSVEGKGTTFKIILPL